MAFRCRIPPSGPRSRPFWQWKIDGERWAALVMAAVVLLPLASRAPAAVVMLSSRCDEKVAFEVSAGGAPPRRYELAARDVLPVPVVGDIEVAFDAAGPRKRYRVPPYTAMAFESRDGKLDLYELRIPAVEARASAANGPGGLAIAKDDAAPEDDPRRHALLTIPVMLLVDDNEPAARAVWEKRLRQRLDDASAVYQRVCRVRFEVAAVGTWESDDAVKDFRQSFREFERKVVPAPRARLAIGFTSQYEVTQSHERLGATRGPLHPYILVREWSPRIGEPQRLEVLVHELGHFLGAVHVADPYSVMRPALTDLRSNARDFPVRSDAVNALALYEVAEEVRTRGARSLAQMSGPAKGRLRAIYAALDKALPDDRAARQYAALLDEPVGALTEPPEVADAVVSGTRAVVRAIVEAAGRPEAATLRGDRLTEHYVRAAARAAAQLPRDSAGQALLLGLGLGLDDSAVLRASRLLGPFCRRVETDDERADRLRRLGQPTVAGRRDLAQHFFVSCALVELVGPAGAEGAGLVKEVLDARRGSGFSFVDLTADLAGVEFGRRVAAGHLAPSALAESFTVADHMPSIQGLEEGIAWQSFVAAYGSADNDRFAREVASIRQRIAALPAYREKR